MDIINNFGIQPYLLVAQIVNFLILFYLLKRFAFKPIITILEKRRREIELGLKNAEEGKQALEKALEEEKKILQKAQTEAQKIINDSKNQADRMSEDIKMQTKMQVENMLQDARTQREREEKEMEKRIALSAARLAVDMVQEAIEGVFTENEQKEALQRFTKNLKKYD